MTTPASGYSRATGRRSRVARFAAAAFLLLIAGSLAAHAQPAAKVSRIGVLVFGTPATEPNLASLVAGLRDLGYVEGRNVEYRYGYADGHPERLRDVALEVAATKPDVIVALGGDVIPYAKSATTTVPLVMLTSNNPVEAGLVASFARPGANLTGVAFVAAETAGKRLQFLREVVPSVKRIAVLWNPAHPDGEYRDIEATAHRLGIAVQSLEVKSPEDFGAAFRSAARANPEALIVVSSRLLNLNRNRILEFAKEQRIPLVSGWGPWAQAGGLLSYGPDLDVLVKRAAAQVDRILKGATPADLPVEQPTKFELVVNLRTAKLLGLTVPASMLRHADQVID